MPRYSTESIRTVALVGHTGAGKTTLAEALLAKAGAIPAAGSVEKGNTVCDFDPLEKEYRHSLNSALVNFAWKNTHIHLIDTPGSPDFMGQAIGALAAVETAVVVVNAETGIQLATDRMRKWAAKRNLCRMIVINRIDAENADLPAILSRIQQAVGRECLPINLPAKGGKDVVDCFFSPEGEADFSSVKEAHSALVDQVVEVDEALMEKYLEQGEVAPEQLHAPFEKALREGHLIPVCFTSAKNGAGIEALLDIFADLAPNATEGNAPPFLKGEGAEAQEFYAVPGPKAHVLAHVFKVVIDPFIGKVGIFRVHQGTVTPNTPLFVGDGRRPFKVGHLFTIQGKDYVETDALVPGDLGAVTKVEEIEFDRVLHDSHDDERHRGRDQEKRRRAAPVRSAAQAGDGGPVLQARAPRDHQRDSDPGPGRPAHARQARQDAAAVQDGAHHQAAQDPVPRDHHAPRRRPLPPQEADGRRGAVRRGVPPRRAPSPRQGLRVRRQGERRRDPQRLHSGGGERGADGPGYGRDRRLPGARHPRDCIRRQAPRGRLEGSRVRLGGPQGHHRRVFKSGGDRPRAHRQYRNR